jgi:hypothetical protein
MAKKRASLIFPPLPLARELKVVQTRMPGFDTDQAFASGLRLRRSPGSAIRFDCFYVAAKAIGAAARPSHSGLNLAIQNSEQWHAPKISALQSRGGDGF